MTGSKTCQQNEKLAKLITLTHDVFYGKDSAAFYNLYSETLRAFSRSETKDERIRVIAYLCADIVRESRQIMPA